MDIRKEDGMCSKLRVVLGIWVMGIAVLLVFDGMANAEEPIRIGVVHNYTDLSGRSIKEGAILAQEQINKEGGIFVKDQGKKLSVELFFANDGGKAQTSSSAVEKLCTMDKVDFLIGANVTELTLAQQEMAMDYKKLFLSSGAAGVQMWGNVKKNYDRYKYYFKFEPLDSLQLGEGMVEIGVQTAKAISKQLNIPIKEAKAAIIAEHSEWAEPVVKMANETFQKEGIDVVYTARPSRDATDLTTELVEATRKGGKMIWVCFSVEAGYALVKQIYDLKLPVVSTGYNSVAQDTAGFWKATAGKGIHAISWTFVPPRIALTPKTIPFYDAHLARWGHPPLTYRGNNQSNNMFLLKEAIEKAGTLNAEKLIPVLETIEYVGIMGVNKVDPKTHNSISGKGYLPNIGIQWREGGKQEVIYPDQLKSAEIQLPPELLKLKK
jgi:branched-chain amino acid transport system substrate-binding protein